MAIIGGMPARFTPLTNLYKEVYQKAEHDVTKMQLSINSHTYIADTSQAASDEFFPPYAEVMNRIS